MKFDYTLTSPEERTAYVEQLLKETPPDKINNKVLGYMSDYILFVADKNQTKKEKEQEHCIITRNRNITVGKRQVSLEAMVANLENGEDGLYAMIRNDKNQILDPKDPITKQDIEEIPGLKSNLQMIESLKRQFDAADTGSKKYSLKQQIISKYQEQYILKASFRGIPAKGHPSNQVKNMAHMPLEENITIDENGIPHSDCIISLFNPAHISFLLCYYTQLKQECVDDLRSDMHFLLLDLENLAEKTLLPDNKILFDLLCWRVDGRSNEEVAELMLNHYSIQHSEQYFSTLWRKRIPKMMAEQAQKDYLIWYYTNEEYGNWKQCGKCGEVKLAHPFFFSKNTSKDGFYSVCKECRGQNK